MVWIQLIVAVLLLVALLIAFYLIIRSLQHTWGLINNVTGKNAMFYGGLLLFMPSQFNQRGNMHRIKLLNTLKLLFPLSLILFGGSYFLNNYGGSV